MNRSNRLQRFFRSILGVFLTALAVPHLIQPMEADTGVQFRTPVGDIEVELYDAEKPLTVQNFLQHVESGLYRDSFIHYLVPGFVAAGGEYTEINRGKSGADFARIALLPGITNEVKSGTVISNLFGTLAMGNIADGPGRPISGAWFFNLGTNSPTLETVNGGYPVFGRVVSGIPVLQTLNGFASSSERDTNALVILFDPNLPFAQGPRPVVPLTLVDHTSIAGLYRNVLWVDVTLLQVHITPTNGTQRITWNAIPGRTNRVEYTESMPPLWKTLSEGVAGTTNGLVIDPVLTRRFYRVRVDPPKT
jgi:peptidyl-prolyl cis-trans isomerase A (cyclophilin A)